MASASPRRRQLLESVGIIPIIVPSEADEDSIVCADASEQARARAFAKTDEAARRLIRENFGEFVAVGADTVVEKDGVILGKPNSDEEARSMFRLLCGGKHNVYSAVCAISSDMRIGRFTERSIVEFLPYDGGIIDEYIAQKKYVGKAGGYGIQDGELGSIAKVVSGRTDTVMGLPLGPLLKLLEGENSWQRWK